jgi:hypothetical protein
MKSIKNIKKILAGFSNVKNVKDVYLQENKYVSLLNQIICTSPHKLRMAQCKFQDKLNKFHLPQVLSIRPRHI